MTQTPANLQKKRGPEPHPERAALRRLFPEWSERTFATFWRAWLRHRAMVNLGLVGEADWGQAIASATRPNGSLNVSRLDEHMESRAAAIVCELMKEKEKDE